MSSSYSVGGSDPRRDACYARALFEDSAVGIAEIAGDGTVRRINARLAGMLGRAPEQYVGAAFEELVTRCAHDVVAGTPGVDRIPVTLLAANGERVPGWCRRLPVTDDGGTTIGYMALLEPREGPRREGDDVAELYREIFTHNVAPKLLVDPDSGRIADANAAAAAFYGWSVDELIGRHVASINVLSPAEIRTEMRRAARQERRYFRFRHRLADGRLREVEVYSSSVVLYGRRYLLSLIHDVTELHRQRRALRVYHDLFEALPVPVFRNTPGFQGRFLTVNPAMVALFQAESREQLLDIPVASLYRDPRQGRRVSEILSEDGRVDGMLLELRTLRGEPLCVRLTAQRVTLSDGAIVDDGILRDITAERAAEGFRRSLLENLGEAVFGVDERGRFTFLNPIAKRVLGVGDDTALLGADAHARIHYRDGEGRHYPAEHCPVLSVLATGEPVREQEDWFRRSDGTAIPVLVYASPLMGVDGRQHGAVVSFQDISKRKRAEAARDQLLDILDATPDIIVMLDADGCILYANRSAQVLRGYRPAPGGVRPDVPQELEGKPLFRPQQFKGQRLFRLGVFPDWAANKVLDHGLPAARDTGVWQGETVLIDVEGREIPVSQVIVAHYDDSGEVVRYSTIIRDVSEQKRLEAALAKEATVDRLTGLYNRTRFETSLQEVLARCRRYGTDAALVMFDLDHFKRVNDTFGHAVGDEVLREISARVVACTREADVIARWGGEEFMLILPDTDLAGAQRMGERLRRAIIENPFAEVGRVTISVGVTALSADDDADHILRRVDDALYRAKRQGRNRVVVSG